MVLDRICGVAYREAFVGMTDAIQATLNAFIPTFFPLNYVSDAFNNAFDEVQTIMKTQAYNVGATMGRNIENQVIRWLNSRIAIETVKIEELLDRVTALESQLGGGKAPSIFGGLFG